MRVIGLTGGIGSGKSTVARVLAELGAVVIDMDSLGHQAIKPGGKAYGQIVQEFGESIVSAGGEIDRTRLGGIVFRNHEALLRLNRIVHPEIDRLLKAELDKYRRRGTKVVVLEAAALLEAGRASQADELWVTVAPEKVVLKRLTERSGYSEEAARSRIESQLTDQERTRRADIIIDTDCSLGELEARVRTEWQKLQGRL
jgi:dephospho-CoA kinase